MYSYAKSSRQAHPVGVLLVFIPNVRAPVPHSEWSEFSPTLLLHCWLTPDGTADEHSTTFENRIQPWACIDSKKCWLWRNLNFCQVTTLQYFLKFLLLFIYPLIQYILPAASPSSLLQVPATHNSFLKTVLSYLTFDTKDCRTFKWIKSADEVLG